MVRFGSVTQIINGDRSSNYPSGDDFQNAGVPFINAGHLLNGKVDYSSMDYISREKYNQLSGAKIRQNDILLCLRGSLGKYALVTIDGGAPASSIAVIRPNTEIIDPHYLLQIIASSVFQKQIEVENNGSSQPNLSAKSVSEFTIPLPSLEEQRNIASALCDVDMMIFTLDKQIAKKRAIKQGAMQELLTGKKRLPGFHGKWRTETIPEVLQKNAGIKIGPFGSQLKKEYLLEDGPFRVYGQENVYRKDFSVGNRYLNRARFEQLQSCEICTGDFLISTMGTIGKCAIVPYGVYRGIMDSHLVRLRIDRQKILPQYLLHLFSEDLGYLKSQTTKLSVGGIMDGLSTKIINSLEIYYPEDLMEQRTIAEMLSNMDEEIDVLKIKLDKYRQVKQGMMQQLLTGKIRLV